jgi:hypothetical protein
LSPDFAVHHEASLFHKLVAGAWLFLLILTALFCVLIRLNTPDTAVGVNAVTEWAEVVAGGGKGLDWNVSGFDLEACDRRGGVVQRVTLPDETELLVKKGVTAKFEKREGSPDVRIDLESRSAAHQQGADLCEAPNGVLVSGTNHTWRPLYGAHVILAFHHSIQHGGPWVSSPRVLELWGEVTMGQTPRVGSDAMLLSGDIDLHATQEHGLASGLFSHFAGEQTYVANTVTLHRGDVIVPPPPVKRRGDDRREIPEARGYVRIPATDGLQVAYYVSTDRITVQRAGNATVTLKLSLWSRVRNEPELSWGLTVLLMLLTTSEFGPAFANAWHLIMWRRQKK